MAGNMINTNLPHCCPVCGGEGVIKIFDPVSTNCMPRIKPCNPCQGQGIVWGPPNAPNNWAISYPQPQPMIDPWIQDPMTVPDPSPVDMERIHEILSDFKKSIDDHVDMTKENNAREVLDIINDPLRKTLIL